MLLILDCWFVGALPIIDDLKGFECPRRMHIFGYKVDGCFAFWDKLLEDRNTEKEEYELIVKCEEGIDG